MSALDSYLEILNSKQGSDLHIKAGSRIAMRLAGQLIPLGQEVWTPEKVEAIARELLGNALWERFHAQRDLDTAVTLPAKGRYRVNVFYQRGNVGLVLRRVKTEIPTIEDLMLPKALKDIAMAPSGLVVVSGPTGCGKSSTLAAMVDWINTQRSAHILTVEDPVEFLHTDKKGTVNQREIGIDTADFDSALRYCLRQDPDVIMIGEMRDQASMQAAIRAAEVGRLVLTTLHTTDAAGIVPRILDLFPQEYQELVRLQLASVFTAGICQRLIPAVLPKRPIAPAVEIIVATPVVKKLIRENKLDKLYAAIETGGEFGMRTLNQSLLELVKNGVITPEQAMSHSLHPEGLKLNLQGIFLDESKRILQTD